MAEPVFAVKSVLDAVLALGLGGDLVAVVDVVFQQGLAFVVDVAQAEGDVELFKLAATAVVPVVTFYPAGAVEVVCVVEEAADVDAHYRHVRVLFKEDMAEGWDGMGWDGMGWD
jgi:hypothetical protein